MLDIESRVVEAWSGYHKNNFNGMKPNFICLSEQDHYRLSKSMNSETLIKQWNGINVLISLSEDNEIFFLKR